ncbi:MAG: hypothetical protein CVT66_09900 [Actinobacteria bacterium HGW-Actinobacteria-6]|nr:MAG: hypothetical protein CVT66_09900 [Actinobacteria bacterium HGW-Actinobacteria-6]
MAITLVGVLLAGAGCTQHEVKDPRAAAVESTVQAYNDALVRGFAKMDMNELSAVATEDQATQEYFLMSALGEERVRMIAHMRALSFDSVVFSGEASATVTTAETWDFTHQSLDTSETVREELGVTYHLRYSLDLIEGQWLVAAVASLDSSSTSQETTP